MEIEINVQEWLKQNYPDYEIVKPVTDQSKFKEEHEQEIKTIFNKCKKELYPILFNDKMEELTKRYSKLVNKYSNKKGFTVVEKSKNDDRKSYKLYNNVNKYDINSSYASALINSLFPAGECHCVLAPSQGIKTVDDLFSWLNGKLAEHVCIKIRGKVQPKYKNYYYTNYNGTHCTTLYDPENNTFTKEILPDLENCDGYRMFDGNSQAVKNFFRMYNVENYEIIFFTYFDGTQKISDEAMQWLIKRKKYINSLTDETQKQIEKIVYNKLVYGNLLNREYKKSINFNKELFSDFLLLGVWIPEYAKEQLLDELEEQMKNDAAIYADTDCIATTGEIRPESIDQEIIGYFKTELLGGTMIIGSIKHYITIDHKKKKVRIYGVLPDVIHLIL